MQSNIDFVHEDNFTTLFDETPISKLAMGTNGYHISQQGDFLQYVGLKHALMSGGINHIDTASHFRDQSSERVVGKVLRTLNEKYGFNRDQFFISSKQGYTQFDEEEQCPRDVEIQEVISKSSGKLTLKDFVHDIDKQKALFNPDN